MMEIIDSFFISGQVIDLCDLNFYYENIFSKMISAPGPFGCHFGASATPPLLSRWSLSSFRGILNVKMCISL